MLAVYSPSTHDIHNSHFQDFDYFSPQFSFHRNSISSTSESSPPPLIPDQWMSTQSTQYQNPAIRVQQSSPFSTADQNTQQQMLAQQYSSNPWGSSASLLSPVNFAHGGGVGGRWEQQQQQQHQRLTGGKHHKRASSASSIASAGPPSPQDSAISIYPRIASGEASQQSPSHFDSLDLFATTNRGFQPKSLPTPVDTPTQHTFTPSDYQHYSSPQDAMRRIHQNRSPNHDDDTTSYNFSGPQSVSSVSHHDSPATPQTASYEGDYGEAVKGLQHSAFNPQLNNLSHGLVTGNFDDFYSNQLQSIPPQQQAQIFAKAGGLSPHRTSLANRFQAAQLDHVTSRSSSPAHSIQRERSPFRPGSYEQPTQMSSMTGQRLGPPQMTPVQYQQQQHQNLTNGAMMAPQRPQQQQAEQPKTVSPKDVELEYHEENQTPLFPSSQQSQYSLPREESNFSTISNLNQPSQLYTSVPTSAPQTQQYSFLGQRRQPSSLRSNNDQPLPDFPAHLASMETTVSSESGQEVQTPVQAPRPISAVRPRDTSADVGAYSCTVSGCTQRFGTAVQLQKHKRDAHRQSSPANASSPALSNAASNHGHVSSAATIANRNSQPGPHRCERTNPQTGKPCNAVFSRPYDLTRHEDTIHTGRKQKVRCHLCTEEKTFSRNDALTRHMRVVHPEVDWPGKTRRKGRD